MRHRHWWGAAVGAGVLAMAALAAPASAAPASAAPASAAPAAPAHSVVVASGAKAKPATPEHTKAKPVVRKGRYVAQRHDGRNNHSQGNGHGNTGNGHGNTGNGHEQHGNGHGNGHDDNDHHPYPCNGTPSLSISAPSRVHAGRTVTVSAKVVLNGVGVRNADVGFYGSIDKGRTLKKYATGVTDANGNVSLAYTATHDVLLRVVVVAKDGLGAAQAQTALDVRR